MTKVKFHGLTNHPLSQLRKLISNYVKVNTDAIDSPVYTGKEQKVAVPDNLLNRIDGTTGTNLTNESNYKATYTAKISSMSQMKVLQLH